MQLAGGIKRLYFKSEANETLNFFGIRLKLS
jgi:hypothetical protein